MTLNDLFALQLDAEGIAYEREYKAIPGRNFRFDFRVGMGTGNHALIELNGGTWMAKSGHNSGSGIARDYEKSNASIIQGIPCFHFTTQMVEDGTAIDQIKEYLEDR